ncbi:MAG TPA: TetR/AcrR family transcriptional regulator C-terminal domain-containing protein [Candidatus Limnocylindrales bacterium]|nr:TetR/AcrR family transcriptional regulator C-terminal domain-containing protein [Candidatus Limnocylindrales bacterium]
MADTQADTETGRRTQLTRDRVIAAAVDAADRGGVEAIRMRRLGQDLGVEAMALYRHVRNKDDLLDGVLDEIVGQLLANPGATEPGAGWKDAMRAQVMAARQVMLRHPWARRVLEDRGTARPVTIAYVNALLAIMVEGGFSMDLAHHALHVLGSRTFGFSQDLLDDTPAEPGRAVDPILAEAMATRYPYVAALAQSVSHDGALGPCDDDAEFAFGFELILDGLEQRRSSR